MPTLLEHAGAPYSGLGRKVLGVVLSSASVLACDGRIGDTPARHTDNAGTNPTDPGSSSSGGAGSGSSGGSGSASPTVDCTSPSPGASPIRRLTRFEYSNTVRELLGDMTRSGDLLPPEQKGNGFSNDAASLTTTRVLVDAYHSVAHDLATRTAHDAAALAKIAPCDAAKSTEDACAQQFVSDFGSRAFRRPIDAAERDAMLGVYATGKSGATHADGIASVIEMVLQSPQFLYRVELGTKSDIPTVAQPGSYEMASRLSFLLWGSMPDGPLLDAAKADQLDTKDEIMAQAKRMIDDPRARDVVRYFHDTLYGINGLDGLQRDATFFPTYTPDLAAMFRQETEHYLDDVVWEGAGDFATMMTGSFTFLNGPLAKFYGIPGITGDAYQRVDLDKTRHAGILTQASLLTSTTPGSHNNPVVRGKFVFTKLLCGQVPDPPVGLVVKEPEADPSRTTRERFLAHRTSATCAACHTMLDSIGFGFEHYNGVGLWQDLDNGKPIDDSGSVPETDAAGAFKGAIELSSKLAASSDAQHCYVGQWLTFAYGRLEQQEDACTHSSLANAFKTSKGNVKDLLLALTQTDAFLYRPLANP